MNTAHIGIGSNLGDRQKNCLDALQLLAKNHRIKIVKISKWYETEAVVNGKLAEMPQFINGAAEIETELSPQKLLTALAEVEKAMGRRYPRAKDEPRTIDLDILLYENLVINEPELKIPHPEMEKRLFVLNPLCDIAPTLVHPVSGKTMAVILSEARDPHAS